MINKENYPHYIVAIGASAGGLEALQDFLTNFPVELKNISIIIAQHLSPTHKSMLVQLLGKNSKLNVQEAKHHAIIETSQVYIAPPDADITVSNEKIILTKPQNQLGPKPSVDLLFQSLANALHERVIGVILSGTGTDGAIGVRAIKKNGGFTLAQEPHTAKYNGMPIAAIDTGDIDSVLLPEKMGEEIKEFVLNPVQFKVIKYSDNEEYNSLDQIFKLLSSRTGTDFSNYKEATVKRRLEKRINELKLKSIKEYLVFIENNPSELDEMFNKILIGVTSFFRDSEAFLALELYIKKIINNSAKKHIRIWAPASSTGEEAYSIAIILARLLKDKINQYNIQIFATDIDDRAITIARKGLYTPEVIQNIPSDILNEYFLKNGNNYELVKSIRSMVLFSKHDVTNNPPFLKLDLICCRNLLIYFGANLQKQIIPLFHYSLNEGGYLFLGKSETVGQFSDLFNTIDAKNKIFQHKKGNAFKTIQFSNFKAKLQHATKMDDNAKSSTTKKSSSLEDIIKETIYSDFENPYVIINENFDIQSVHGDVRLFLSFSPGNINVNLIKMVNLELQIELRAIITKAIKDFKNIKSPIKKFNLFGQIHFVRLCVKPLKSISFSDNLLMVIFEKLEIDEFILKENLITDKELIDNRVQELEKELIQTKEHLQTFIEELETSNEELQSLNEEMHSTNEELQSSNEELETSNEELQSTNEEVQIAYTELKLVNDELFKKEKLLTEKQAKLNALLDNNLQGFILVDESYLSITFNDKAKSIFSLFSTKPLNEGASLFDYFENNALEELIVDFKATMTGKSINRQLFINDLTGNKICFKVNFTPIINEIGEVKSFSFGLIEITTEVIALEKLTKAEKLLDAVFNATAVGVCITDENGILIDVNNEYCKIYGYTKEELIGNSFTMVVPTDYKPMLQSLYDEFINGKEELASEWQVQRKNGTIIDIYASAELLIQPDGKKYKVTSIRDITENKKYKNLLFETQESGKIGGIELDFINHEFSYSEEIATIFALDPTEILTFDGFINYFKDEAKISIKNNFETIQKNGNSFDLELELLTKKITYKWVRITAKAIKNYDNIVKVYATVQDISKEKQHELQILETNERFEYVTKATFDAIWDWDIQNDLIYWGEGFRTLFGYENVNTFVNGKENWVQRIHENDLAQVELELNKFIESTENNWKFEYQYLKADGSYVFVIDKAISIRNESGKVIRMIGAMQDLTEQKIKEERLNLFQSVIENTNDGVIITKAEPFDEPNPEIIYANNAMTQISGYSQKELIGSSPRLMQGPDTSMEELDKIRKAIKNWQPLETEIINYKKNGEEFWLNYSIVPVANEKGLFTHWISIERDITARKKAEQEREQLLNELTKNNKELKQFSYITSHNMRSPLTNILAILEMFDYLKFDDETINLIDALKQSTNNLHETLNDLIKILIIKENTNLQLENLNMEEVFTGVTNSINSLITQSNAQINLNFSKAPKLNYSKSYLESVFLNLLTNSIKYASKECNLQITVSTKLENKKIKLTYTDNGLGFDMEKVKDKIFGLYQRFHTHTDSKGIGLYLVYSQIVALGGTIKVDSEVNKGTTFTIHF